MPTNPTIATDSAAELHKLIGDDATATFENDPNYINSDPTGTASSENLNEQRPGAGNEFIDSVSAKTADIDDDDEDAEDDDDLEDDEADEDDDDLEDDDVDEDLDDEDDELEDDDDEDEDEDDEDEDDEDEVEASASSSSATLWADGLLGYEDRVRGAKPSALAASARPCARPKMRRRVWTA